MAVTLWSRKFIFQQQILRYIVKSNVGVVQILDENDRVVQHIIRWQLVNRRSLQNNIYDHVKHDP